MSRNTRMLIPAAGLLLAGVLAAVGIGLWRSIPDTNEPEGYGRVPEFSLTERAGRPFHSRELQGKVWIADFIFTSCGGPCPMMTARMARLQEQNQAQNDLRLVSFTVDPERDTPEVLSRYADQYGASADRWAFLTGEREVIYRLAREGMFLAVGEGGGQSEAADDWGVVHSLRFVLVDRDMIIRGYYDAADESAMARLQKDLTRLLTRKS